MEVHENKELVMAKTIADKIWQSHIVEQINEEEALLYIDLHLLHEINTPQAFERIKEKQRDILRPELTFATEDHNTPTRNIDLLESEVMVKEQVRLLRTKLCRTQYRTSLVR